MVRRRTGLLVSSVIVVGILGNNGTAAAQPTPATKIGPRQFFVGMVNGKSADAVIAVVCPGPLRPGQLGHPLNDEVALEEFLPPAPTTSGYTGSHGRSVVATFVVPNGASINTVTFTHYGTKAIPNTFLLPCSGSGTVVFSPEPTSHSARSARVPVTYVPTCLDICPVTRVDGEYRIVSTDCYFGAGACRARFDIEQTGTTLSDPSDKLFHGVVHGTHVHFGETWPPGVSEDSWWCSGTTADFGRTISGTMTDGLDGSGTFVMTYLGP